MNSPLKQNVLFAILQILGVIVLFEVFLQGSVIIYIFYVSFSLLFIVISRNIASRISNDMIISIGEGYYGVIYGTLMVPEFVLILLILGRGNSFDFVIFVLWFVGYLLNPFVIPKLLNKARTPRKKEPISDSSHETRNNY